MLGPLSDGSYACAEKFHKAFRSSPALWVSVISHVHVSHAVLEAWTMEQSGPGRSWGCSC